MDIQEQIDFLRVSSAGKFDEMADTMTAMLAVVEAARKYTDIATFPRDIDEGEAMNDLDRALAKLALSNLKGEE